MKMKKTTALAVLALLCIAITVSCGKVTPSVTGPAGNLTTTPGADVDKTTPTPTSSPTPTPFDPKTAYEKAGVEDVYKIPVTELKKDWTVMSVTATGDYVLIWITRVNIPSGEKAEQDKCILIKPGENTEQYSFSADYTVSQPLVFPDGTIAVPEWGTDKIHVYDNTLKELRTIDPEEEGELTVVGSSENGLIWFSKEGEPCLIAYDLKGEKVKEYTYDDCTHVALYLGQQDGLYCFEAVSTDENYTHSYIYLNAENGEITYLGRLDEDLGSEWSGIGTSLIGPYEIADADSTWFIHSPGNKDDALVFTKSEFREFASIAYGDKICSWLTRYDENNKDYQAFRVYDLTKKTVSDKLVCTELKGYMSVHLRCLLGDGLVLLTALNEDGCEELLLWTASEKTSEIKDICELSKDDPSEYLKTLYSTLKTDYKIAITPDKNADTDETLGDVLTSVEFANRFLVEAKNGAPALALGEATEIKPENMRNNDGANFEFNPHVFSSYYLREFGERRRDALFSMIDALRAGEDYFPCPDEDAAGWACGRFTAYFFPVADRYIYADYVGNGKGKIYYLIPKEEFFEKERDFEERICAIINDVVEEDYSDFEKALALYEFMTEYAVYDYEMLDHLGEWSELQSGYRVLIEKKGICWEISALYRYLLLQCGVDCEEMSGDPVVEGEDSHMWNYIELDGKGYLIDATWGQTSNRLPDLKYFLFTDELRETRDGYKSASFSIAGNGMYSSRQKYSFDSVDERYKELWDGYYVAFDEDLDCIFYLDANGTLKRFDYSQNAALTE